MSERAADSAGLTNAQKRRFVRRGVVVVEDAVDEGVLRRARESFWASLPEAVDEDDPTTWDESRYEDGLDERPEPADREAHEALLREVYPYAADLVGPKLAPPDDPPDERCYHAKHNDVHVEYDHDGLVSPYPNYPGADDYPDDLFPHLDGGAPPEEFPNDYTPFTVVLGVYVDDVVPGDGGFTVWPGSHEVVGDYFEGHNDVDFYHETLVDISLPEAFELGPPMEVVGEAGTAFVAHPALVHSVGPNLSGRIRQMCLCRLARVDVEFNDLEALVSIWEPFDGVSP